MLTPWKKKTWSATPHLSSFEIEIKYLSKQLASTLSENAWKCLALIVQKLRWPCNFKPHLNTDNLKISEVFIYENNLKFLLFFKKMFDLKIKIYKLLIQLNKKT